MFEHIEKSLELAKETIDVRWWVTTEEAFRDLNDTADILTTMRDALWRDGTYVIESPARTLRVPIGPF